MVGLCEDSNEPPGSLKANNLDGIDDSEMIFGEMRLRIRHRLHDIRLTIGENLGKNLNQQCVKMESEPHFTNCLKIGTPQSSVKHEPHSDHEVDHSYSTGQELLSDAFTFVEVKSELEENIKDMASMWKLSHKRRVRNISSIRRSKDAERQRVKRCTESQEKRAERLRKDAERKRTKRAAEVASERARRLRSNVDRRATETEAERAERLKRDAERQRLKRATETEDERARRLRRDNERKRFKRATESEAERTERLRKDTERKRFKRAAEMQTDRTKRLHIRTEQQNGVHWGQDGQAEHSLFGPLLQVSVAFPKFLEEIEIFPRVGSEPRETQSSVSSDKMHVPPCERTSDSSLTPEGTHPRLAVETWLPVWYVVSQFPDLGG
ncbi:hypothetical protein ANN_18382 [Periplaneta americana]|uniref:Uncharacterized protein n=1 Tax=Periplaneta americana TaxID=6978 RepID=A0ABQ8SNK8_PERAM|nr:hypothetical protein ANN_18382 [Periplaneta americana]